MTPRRVSPHRWVTDRTTKIAFDLDPPPSHFVIAPLGALAFDRPLFGNWIWHIDLEKAKDYE